MDLSKERQEGREGIPREGEKDTYSGWQLKLRVWPPEGHFILHTLSPSEGRESWESHHKKWQLGPLPPPGVTWDTVLSTHFHESPREALSSWVCPWDCLGQWYINRSSKVGFSGKPLRNGQTTVTCSFCLSPNVAPGLGYGYQGWNSSIHSEGTIQFNMCKMISVQGICCIIICDSKWL